MKGSGSAKIGVDSNSRQDSWIFIIFCFVFAIWYNADS